MIHTDELWEDVEGTAVLRDLTNQPGLHRYVCVEIPLNVQLFHLDVCSQLRYEEKWSRFIFGDIRDALPFLEANEAEKIRLSIQTRRRDGGNYKILEVHKIISGTITPDSENFAFICSDYIKYYESIADLSVGEFTNEMVIWKSAM